MRTDDGDGGGGTPQSHSRNGETPDGKRKRRRRSRRRKAKQKTGEAQIAANAQAEVPCASPTDRPDDGAQKKSKSDAGGKPSNPPHDARRRHNRAKGGSDIRRRYHHRDAFRDRPAYAALDLGTNNCRLLVAVPDGHSFRVVDAFSRIVRLGEGIARSGRLSDEAMERAVEALKVCAGKLKDRGIKRLRLIATEACRIAENGEGFLTRVRDETGLDLEVVNRETEARLAVSGCASLVDRKADGAILFDIGGGSSELVWIDLAGADGQLNPKGKNGSHRPEKKIRSWASLPVGVVNISERHGGVNVTPQSFEGMVEEVIDLLDDFPQADALTKAVTQGRVHMLGTSGTVTTLAGVHLGLKTYDRKRVDGIWMDDKDVSAMTGKLLSMSFDERVNNACIGKERADLVLAGCAILEALRRKWPCSRLRVADRGLREGILYELMMEDGVLRSRRGPRRKHKRHKPKTSQRPGEDRVEARPSIKGAD
ncbi:MAG: Ppx/GppA phosphatase family protein [Pseudomonadota bacterium]